MPLYTTSLTLTLFAHDVEKFECVQRIYDVVLASHPLMIVYLVVATILLYKEELEENADEYQSSVCFFVFKAPLQKLNQIENVETMIRTALDLE